MLYHIFSFCICVVSVQCQGHLIQRGDDTPEIIHTRLQSYAEETLPLLRHYHSQHLTVTVLDPSGAPVPVTVPMPMVRWTVHQVRRPKHKTRYIGRIFKFGCISCLYHANSRTF